MTYIDEPAAGAYVDFTEPTATDDSGEVTVSYQTSKPGSFFKVGSTAVTYYFRDGNFNSAKCRFTIVVEASKCVELRHNLYLSRIVPRASSIGTLTKLPTPSFEC